MGRSGRHWRNLGKSGARGSKRAQPDGLVQLPRIPDDIIFGNIIPRLPGKSLIRFKCVSRLWNSTISDLNSTLSGDLRHAEAVFMSLKYLEESNHRPDKSTIRFYFMDSEKLTQEFSCKRAASCYDQETCIAGSCNGLLLIIIGTSFYLWNPWTTYFSHVLELDDLEYCYCVINSGICYCSRTDDYKVVTGLQNENYTPEFSRGPVLVTGLRNKCWREIYFPYRCSMGPGGVLFNGFLHWRANTEDDFCDENHLILPNKIVAFDPNADQVREVPVPPQCRRKEESAFILGLGVLDGCLCCTACWENEVVEVIAMKEYGVEESWTCLFHIPNLEFDTGPYNGELLPLMRMKNGQVLMFMGDSPVFSYDPRAMEYDYDYEVFGEWPHMFIKSLNSPAGLEWDEKQHQGKYEPYGYSEDCDMEWAENQDQKA